MVILLTLFCPMSININVTLISNAFPEYVCLLFFQKQMNVNNRNEYTLYLFREEPFFYEVRGILASIDNLKLHITFIGAVLIFALSTQFHPGCILIKQSEVNNQHTSCHLLPSRLAPNNHLLLQETVIPR